MSAMQRLHLPGHEPRPHIERDLSNWDQVSAYYTDHGPNETFQKVFFVVMEEFLVAPTTVMAPGAREEIEDHMASGNPTILAMTHHSFFDPSNDSAVLQKDKELFEGVVGKCIVPARLGLIPALQIPAIGSIIATGGW